MTTTELVPDQAQATDAVATLLRYCGYDPLDPGLLDTPARVARALRELTSGEHSVPGDHLARVFDANDMDVDQMILLRRVPFVSLCEHHLLPFVGHASVAYLPSPGAQVVGLSKLARVVEDYSRRLQVQERLTAQVARCIDEHTDNEGVAVMLSARHLCMSIRGVRKENAVMVTSKLLGAFRTDAQTRGEFLSLARGE